MIGPSDVITTPPPKAHLSNFANGLPLGCFGPFPSPNIDRSSFTQAQNQFIPGSLGKRKRRDISGSDSPRNSVPQLLVQSDTGHMSPSATVAQVRTNVEIDHSPTNFDLNKNPAALRNDISSCSRSLSVELEKTAEVGMELGFEIDSTNPVLLETMGAVGEDNNPQ